MNPFKFVRSHWKFFIGSSISLFLLWVVFHQVRFSLLWQTLSRAHYVYLVPVLAILYGNMALRAARWDFLLRPVKRVSFSTLIGSLFIGFMANNLLPARMGDVLRGYIMGKVEGISKTSSFATIVVEKLFDAITVLSFLMVLFVTVKNMQTYPSFKKALKVGGYVSFGIFAVTLSVLFFIKNYFEQFCRVIAWALAPFSKLALGWSERGVQHLHSFREGLLSAERWDYLSAAFLFSFLTWGTYALAIHITCLTFRVTLPLSASFLAMVAICLGTVIPFTPGYIGTYHAAVTYSLLLYRVPLEKAVGISLVFHASCFLLTTLMGFFYLWRYRISFRRVKEEVVEGPEPT